MSNYTKGPLKAEPAIPELEIDGFCVIHELSDDVIGFAPDGGSHDGLANAMLWAAAPDLLADLKAMLEMFAQLQEKVNWGASAIDADTIRKMNDAPSSARATIRKAQGEDPC